jgi:hypothetical protein
MRCLDVVTPLASNQREHERALRRPPAYDAIRIAVGLLLLTAAALKGWQLTTGPILAKGLLDSRPVLIAEVEFELLFGFWLLAGIAPRQTWRVALVCFSLFTCVSLYKGLTGHATCGCFGRVPVNPWITGSLDLVIVAALLRWRPSVCASSGEESCRETREEAIATETSRRGWRTIAVLVALLITGLPVAYAMASQRDATLSEFGDIVGDSNVVILNPGGWIGKQLPLIRFIDIDQDLARGHWMIVLYRHDCPRCQEAIDELPQIARQMGSPRVAIIAMPPHGSSSPRLVCADMVSAHGVLRDPVEWFVETPLILSLEDGIVTASPAVHAESGGSLWKGRM